jgi:putative addiction module component (TIGR02574 family)
MDLGCRLPGLVYRGFMTKTEIKKAVAELSVEEQAELAEEIWDRVEQKARLSLEDEELVDERFSAYQSRPENAVDGPAAMNRIRARLRKEHGGTV